MSAVVNWKPVKLCDLAQAKCIIIRTEPIRPTFQILTLQFVFFQVVRSLSFFQSQFEMKVKGSEILITYEREERNLVRSKNC